MTSSSSQMNCPTLPKLNLLAYVLSSITQAQGEMTFSLVEHAEMLAQAGSDTTVPGIRHGAIAQTLNDHGGKIIGEIEPMFRGSEFSTALAMEPGLFIVLARSSLSPPPETDSDVPASPIRM